MEIRFLLLLLSVLSLFSVTSCMSSQSVRGILFHDVTLPFDINMIEAKVTNQSGSARITRVREPFTAFGLSAEEGVHGIADAAQSGGISTIHLVDMRSRSIAFGLWQRKTVIVWGE